jgi:uncharacterized protein YecE (DUF72 family)
VTAVAATALAPVVVGTSGFSFADWVGPFYPSGTRGPDMLAYYAQHFASVELNSSYYGIPRPGTMELLDRKTPDGFEFVVKGYKSMTHEQSGPSPEDLAAFRECLGPLRAAGKLRGVLLQFPWSFRPTQAARKRLEALHQALSPEAPLFVEFRHASWLVPRVFEFLEQRGMGYCSVDEPTLPGLVPPEARVTGEQAYVRLHGRNRDTWWGRGGDRYDYNYTPEELSEWVRKIRELAERSKQVYVFFNNCHAGQAARNALLMRDMLQQDLGPGVR